MSFWVYLNDHEDEPVRVSEHREGGVYRANGCDEAELNVSYNFSEFYHLTLDEELGLRWLNGRMAKDVLERLRFAVSKLGDKKNPDPWKPEAGNAGHALKILLDWAERNPEATFVVL